MGRCLHTKCFKSPPHTGNKVELPTPNTLNCRRCNCGVCSVGYRNTLIMDCNFAWTMLDTTKIAQVVVHTSRISNHLHALDTEFNNHHQQAKVQTSADKATNVVSSDICWFMPHLQKWDIDPKICTELLAQWCFVTLIFLWPFFDLLDVDMYGHVLLLISTKLKKCGKCIGSIIKWTRSSLKREKMTQIKVVFLKKFPSTKCSVIQNGSLREELISKKSRSSSFYLCSKIRIKI